MTYTGQIFPSPSPSGVITAVSVGTGLAGGGTDGDISISLANTSVVPGSYTYASITIDAQGRITLASSGDPPAGTDLSYTAGSRLLLSSTGSGVTLPLFTVSSAGLVPDSPGGTTNYLRADGNWATPPSAATDLSYVASTRLLQSSSGNDVTLPIFSSSSSDAGLVPGSSSVGVNSFLRADGVWATPPSLFTDLSYTASSRLLESSTGDDVVLPLFSTKSSTAGLVPGSVIGGTSNYLRADGIWSAPSGNPTNLTYTANSRLLESSTGTDVTLPLFSTSSSDAGLVPGSSTGGTTNFLRADRTWAAPPSGSTNLSYTASSRLLESSTGTDVTIPLFATDSANAGLVPGSSTGGTTNFLRADGTWAIPPGSYTDLSYTASTRLLESSSGTDVTIPLFAVDSTNAGLVPGSSTGGTSNFLRADGTWAAPPSSTTNLSYTASTRLLESSTGTDVTLPLFATNSNNAGLVPGSSTGGTTNFLRADGTWAVPTGAAEVTIGGGVSDILSASGGAISAVDATVDKLVFWDESSNKLTYLTIGSGLTISGTEITSSGGTSSGVDPVIASMIF